MTWANQVMAIQFTIGQGAIIMSTHIIDTIEQPVGLDQNYDSIADFKYGFTRIFQIINLSNFDKFRHGRSPYFETRPA
jgi:hypothetical protein